MSIVEQKTQLEFPLDNTALKTPLNVSADPESQFLHTSALNVYPELKARHPDISIREIQETAEQFKGASIKDYIELFLVRAVNEQRPPTSSKLAYSPRQLSFSDYRSEVPTNFSHSSFLRRLKGPLQAAAIKLQSVKIPFR